MSPLFRRRGAAAPAPDAAAPSADAVTARDAGGIAPRRPHAGALRRERRALLKAREVRLRDLGGLLVEMYRRGAFRDDLLQERCADVVGIDARLAEIDDLLHHRRHAPRCECGAVILRGSHFCPNCGRPVGPATANGSGADETAIDRTPAEDA
jgi:hypothetical protein